MDHIQNAADGTGRVFSSIGFTTKYLFNEPNEENELRFSCSRLGAFLGGVALTAFAITINVFTPFLLKHTIAILSPSNPEQKAKFLGIELDLQATIIAYGVAWTVGSILGYLKNMVLANLVSTAGTNLSNDAVSKLNKLDKEVRLNDRSYQNFQLADKAFVGATGAQKITKGLVGLIPDLIQVLIIGGIVSATFDGAINGTFWGVLAAQTLASIFGANFTAKYQKSSVSSSREYFNQGLSSFTNYNLIRTFGKQETSEQQFREAGRQYKTASNKLSYNDNTQPLIYTLIAGVGLTIISVFAVDDISDAAQPEFDISSFVLVNTYILLFIQPLFKLATSFQTLIAGSSDVTTLRNLLNKYDIEADNSPNLLEDEQAIRRFTEGDNIHLQFNNVNYRFPTYQPDEANPINGQLQRGNGPALYVHGGISFTAQHNQIIGIIGETGIGKSTLVDLIYRNFDVSEGEISISYQTAGHQRVSRNIRDIPRKDWQASTAICLQEANEILASTMLDNIAFAHRRYNAEFAADPTDTGPGATVIRNDSVASIGHAQLTPVYQREIATPDIRFVNFSGGERKRFQAAQAFNKGNPAANNHIRIYIFDEVTSGLDANTEGLILDYINQTLRDPHVIIFVITHTLRNLVRLNADQVLYFERNAANHVTMVSDTHDNLRNTNPGYQALWNAQNPPQPAPAAAPAPAPAPAAPGGGVGTG